jgi:biotin carboxylase
MQKKLIVLGAGVYQVPLIDRARSLGCQTLVVSIPGDYPGFSHADQVFYLNTRDCEGVLDLAREQHADGIATTGTDVAVRTIGYVCDHLGLPGVSEHAARTLTDKSLMKQVFAGHVCTSDFRIVHDLDEARWAAEDLGFPVMVKACDVSGSRGVTRVDSPQELAAAFSSSVSASHTTHYVVERCVIGTEIGIDAFVKDGRLQICLPHNKAVWSNRGVTIPAGHSFPFVAGPRTRAAIQEQVEAIVSCTGMDNCAINSDAMITPDGGVSIIEAGARCGATCIPELIQLHTGIDYYEQVIRCALGEECDFRPTRQNACEARLVFSRKTGTVRSVDLAQLDALRSDRVSISLDVAAGSHVQEAHDGTDRIGQLIVRDPHAGEVDRLLEQVAACISVA